MTRTTHLLALAGVTSSTGVTASLWNGLEQPLRVVGLFVTILSGLSILYFGWRREIRHQRREDMQIEQARDYLNMQKLQRHAMKIDAELLSSGFPTDDLLASPDRNHDQ